MPRRRKMLPEEAVKLQEDIESYLAGKAVAQQEGETLPSRCADGGGNQKWRDAFEPAPVSQYEQRHDKALRERDDRFFEEVAALCRSTKGRRVLSAGDEEEVKRIAVLARMWLKNNDLPARIWLKYDGYSGTGDLVRKLTEIIW